MFTNVLLEKFLLTNSRHARSGEMRRRLYYCHPKSRQVRLQTNAATKPDFHNQFGLQTCYTTFAEINGHLNPFVNSNNCNFTLIKQCYAGGVFRRNGCEMPVLPVNVGRGLQSSVSGVFCFLDPNTYYILILF